MSPVLGIIASANQSGRITAVGSYDALATATIPSGGLASITFAGIPTGYKHLQIRAIGRASAVATNWSMTFNGDTNNANYYSRHLMYADGSTVASVFNQTLVGITGGSLAPTVTSLSSPNIIDLLDYADVSKNKTVRYLAGYDNNGSGIILLGSGLWINTAAISNIVIASYGGTIAENSQFALYGVK
jgi:hypothetical protein